ncbi:MAG: lytic transglycosylase domain-containing protein [Clostridia bacterium]|nr:lytic transglycosylase domain-containing protein [Clostridia bacterium]
MKKTLTIISILIASALIAFFWTKIDTAIEKKNHPLEHLETVEKYADEHSVPKELILAVIKTESKFKSDAVSSAGAVGLMQITPETFMWLCQKNSDTENDPNLLYTPEINIQYGVYYLDMLYSEFGSWESALAAYNAGPSRVREWLKNDEYASDGILTHIPYKETREYVQKVMTAKNKYTELYFENN